MHTSQDIFTVHVPAGSAPDDGAFLQDLDVNDKMASDSRIIEATTDLAQRIRARMRRLGVSGV